MQHQESLLFNYSDIFFSHYFNDDASCVHMSKNHALTYIYSGEMIIEGKGRQTIIGENECGFIKRDYNMTIRKQSKNGEQYQGIFLMFTCSFLREYGCRI